MIKISVNESVAFDMLSILQVKSLKNAFSQTAFDNLIDFGKEIISEIGSKKCDEILRSNEYYDLAKINDEIYEKINEINLGKKIDAKVIDNLNHTRYRLKQEIQKKFFNDDLAEQKFGYKHD